LFERKMLEVGSDCDHETTSCAKSDGHQMDNYADNYTDNSADNDHEELQQEESSSVVSVGLRKRKLLPQPQGTMEEEEGLEKHHEIVDSENDYNDDEDEYEEDDYQEEEEVEDENGEATMTLELKTFSSSGKTTVAKIVTPRSRERTPVRTYSFDPGEVRVVMEVEVEGEKGKTKKRTTMFRCPHPGCDKAYPKPWRLEEHLCTHTGQVPCSLTALHSV